MCPLVRCIPVFFWALGVLPLRGQTPVGGPTDGPFKNQDYQSPQVCMQCHPRQYEELRSSVKSGYRNVSPLFNGLELSANLLNGGLLRPVYATSTKTLPLANGTSIPFTTNMFTTPVFEALNQVRAGFCLGCHNGPYMKEADNPSMREVPIEDNGPAFEFAEAILAGPDGGWVSGQNLPATGGLLP